MLWRRVRQPRCRPGGSADPATLSAAVGGLVASPSTVTPWSREPSTADGRAVPTAAQEKARSTSPQLLTCSAPSGRGRRPIRLPEDIERPNVDQAAVDEAMASFATPAASGPLTIVVDGTLDHRSRPPVAPPWPWNRSAVDWSRASTDLKSWSPRWWRAIPLRSPQRTRPYGWRVASPSSCPHAAATATSDRSRRRRVAGVAHASANSSP